MTLSKLIRCAGFFCFAVAGVTSLRADIELPRTPPPQAAPVVVQVGIGESVDIPLTAVSRSGGQFRFFLRSQPSLGALSEISSTSRTTASVRYTHDPSLGAGMDSFKFAVQAPGTGVSTPAEVLVQVVDEPPLFVAPGSLTFPAAAVGESSLGLLVLRNDGGGTVTGQIQLGPPFSFPAGDNTFALGQGESIEIPIRFTPTEARQYELAAGYSHDPSLRTGLSARAFAPVETAPRKVELESSGADNLRRGRLTIRNMTEQPKTLQIGVPAEVVAPESIELAPRSEETLELITKAGFLGAKEGQISLKGDSVDLSVPLQIFAAPAKIRVTGAETGLDFGTLKTGETVQRTIVLHNDGGTEALVTARSPRGLTLDPEPSHAPLPPQSKREIELTFVRTVPQEVRDNLVFEADQTKITLPVTAKIISISTRPDTSEQSLAKVAALAARQGFVLPEVSDVPAIEELGVTRRTKTELDLVWQAPPGPVDKYVVLQRKFEFGADGEPRARWEPMKNARVLTESNRGRAFITGLRPGEQIAIAVHSVDAAGVRSQPSLPFIISSEPSTPWQIPWPWIAAAVFLASVATLVISRRKRRAAMYQALERQF